MSNKTVITDDQLWMFNWEYQKDIANVMNIYYNDDKRYYHSANHIIDSYNTLHKMLRGLNLKYTVELYTALLFHDIIYNIPSAPGENEQQSADMCVAIYKQYKNSHKTENVDLGVVKEIIMSTVHNGAPYDLVECRYMINIDLYQLGTSEYRINSENVEKEYLTVYNPYEFLVGRCKFLSSMLNRERIFYRLGNGADQHMLNDLTFNLMEIRARENMKRELTVVEMSLKKYPSV